MTSVRVFTGLMLFRNAAKTAGKLRTEGKDYIVKDGDCVYVLFNK